ncbi:MAG: hypothetical protein AB7P42_00445 [Gammaproteobacteria bacterium]
MLFAVALCACSDKPSDPAPVSAAPAEHRELETAVKAPLDKAAGVNSLIDEQDAAQRRAMDEQGR